MGFGGGRGFTVGSREFGGQLAFSVVCAGLDLEVHRFVWGLFKSFCDFFLVFRVLRDFRSVWIFRRGIVAIV